MVSEPYLPLFEPKPADPNIAWLEHLLDVIRDWMTAKEISSASRGKLDDRAIRMLASGTPRIISGQRGYRHSRHATLEELDHAGSWLVSQGKRMIKRGIAIRRHAHGRLG